MSITDKDIYFEFLDNDVPLGKLPKTIAFGRNGSMTVLDPIALSNIDRFKEVNIAAKFHYNEYPGNPNGSDKSTAAICSKDGRHLAIMPHLERSIFPWNWAHYPRERNDKFSPWILPFYNARKWLDENA